LESLPSPPRPVRESSIQLVRTRRQRQLDTTHPAMSTYTQAQARPPPAQLKRTGSFFGAIKDIVTAPLTWFGGGEEDFGDSDAKGKRRRLQIPSDQTRGEEDSEQRTKRMRVGSSPNRDKQPYLDPPRSAFNHTHKTIAGARVQNQRHASPSPRKALRVPSATPRSRRTMSPYPSGSQSKVQPVVRTMSLDPPSGLGYSGTISRLQPAPTMQDLTEEDNAMSISREPSMSNLRMRTSITPQPSGSDFGPIVPHRRERDPTEPPPLTALLSNPVFVKPPPGLQKSSATEVTRQATLGSLLDSQRGVSIISLVLSSALIRISQQTPPVRRGSVLFGTGSMTDVSARACARFFT
jgi:nucleoporin NUP1